MKLFNLPNLLTLGNLFSGLLALFILILKPEITDLSLYILLGLFAASLVFDFLDGLVARVLKQQSEIGVQLDSFADAISFGVVPAFLLLVHFSSSEIEYWVNFFSDNENLIGIFYSVGEDQEGIAEINMIMLQETILPRLLLSASILLIPLFSVLRLAKFNVNGSSLSYFQGLPTPANAILIYALVCAIYFQPEQIFVDYLSNPWFMLVFVGIVCVLLISNIPLFSFKIKKSVSFRNYTPQLVFILLLIPLVYFMTYLGIFLGIILYIQLSLIFRNKIVCQ